jgi:hypothetical protein
MPGGGPVIRPNDTVETLWFAAAFEPCFGAVFVGVTFAGRSDDPVWTLWALRAFIALFFCFFGTWTTVKVFAELRKRGHWLPPGAVGYPWPAAAAYVTAAHLMATVLLVGFITVVTLLSGSTN